RGIVAGPAAACKCDTWRAHPARCSARKALFPARNARIRRAVKRPAARHGPCERKRAAGRTHRPGQGGRMKRLTIGLALCGLLAAGAATAETQVYYGFHIGISNAPPPPRI